MDSQTLTEILAIQHLKARYYRFMDTKQWDDWRTCFTDDLVYYRDAASTPSDVEPTDTSGDEFVARVSRNLAEAVTVHHGHMSEIELTSERTATGIWAMFDYVHQPGEEQAFQGYGHYHEQYEKGDDGQWRIKRMRLTRLRVDRVTPTPR